MVIRKTATYIDSFGVEHSRRKLIRFKIMPGYFFIGFIDFMFKGKTQTDFENYLVLPHNSKKNINMNKPHVHDKKYIYLQLGNALQFRLSSTQRNKKNTISEINHREKMRRDLITISHTILE